jgi:hypothetical protein
MFKRILKVEESSRLRRKAAGAVKYQNYSPSAEGHLFPGIGSK